MLKRSKELEEKDYNGLRKAKELENQHKVFYKIPIAKGYLLVPEEKYLSRQEYYNTISTDKITRYEQKNGQKVQINTNKRRRSRTKKNK